MESIADPMVVYDTDWRVRWENDAALRTFQATGHGSMVGQTLWASYPDLSGTEFEREMRRAMDTRVPTAFSGKRGSTWTEVRCYPIPGGGIAAVWKNITEQKRAEVMMRYLTEASAILTRSLDHDVTCTALAQLVVPELADWCTISLLEGTVIRMVAVAHSDPEKVKKARAFDAKYPSSPEGSTRTAHVIRTGESEVIPEITDAMLDASIADPEYRALVRELGFKSVITVPLSSRGRIFGAMSMVGMGKRHFTPDDLTLAEGLARRAAIAVDNATLYRDAEVARASAEAANELKSAFLARMSHELRTPLNAIGGYVDLLAMGVRGELSQLVLTDLERIKRSQHHLLALINDLLNYARMEAGKLTYDIRPISVRELLLNIEALFAPQLLQKKLTYCLELTEAELTVNVDPDKAQQVLFNLVSNAVKFTPAGGRISVSASAVERAVEIRVQDTGIGIPPEKLETIFEPFVQLGRAGIMSEGTGLGLAISRDLARAMKGDIVARSDGSGSTFTVRFPR